MNDRFYLMLLRLASLLGIIGVAFGAFGAHFLKSRLDEQSIEVVKTGVLYLFIHTITSLFIVLIGKNDTTSRYLKASGVFFIIGILLFSGSLFLIGTKSLTSWSIGYFGILTPIGGLCFILGWLMLLLYALTRRT